MHPLAAPGALWVLSRAGKVPRPPAGGRNLPQETDFLWKARERAFTFFFCFSGAFASAEATKGLSGRPLETFGAHPAEADGDRKKWISCGRQGKEPFLLFSVSQRFLPLRRRPGGFPVAPWTPSGPLSFEANGNHENVGFFARQGNRFSCAGRAKERPPRNPRRPCSVLFHNIAGDVIHTILHLALSILQGIHGPYIDLNPCVMQRLHPLSGERLIIDVQIQ